MKSQSHPSRQAQQSALRIRVVADKTVAGRAPQRIVGLRTGSEQRLWVRLLTISLVTSSPIIAAALSGAGIWLFRAAILFGLGLGLALLVYLTLPSDYDSRSVVLSRTGGGRGICRSVGTGLGAGASAADFLGLQ